MELVPGLPNDVVLECLIRVPYDHFSSVASVCRSWKGEIELPEFWARRKIAGFSQPVVVMAQARVDPTQVATGAVKLSVNPAYRLTISQPETAQWNELPPVPGYSDGLPMFCRLAGVGLNLVVMGGWDPVTWEVSNEVFVYNFVSATWRRGADMPGGPRSLFACASDLDRTVLVAGGHDKEKNALRSAMVYDVAEDEWVQLPDMAMDRDECKGVFHGGKFHVIGGYNTEMQGQFSTTAEAFDVAAWKWDQLQDNFLGTATCPSTCLDGGDGILYMCRENDVVALRRSTWQAVTELPAEVRSGRACMTAWQDKMFVIGSPRFSEGHVGYLLDLKCYRWRKVESPTAEFSGHVQSGCWLSI
ncbi:hypothetical protein U1Q18_006644 [Sarracenia purpurea var. burkii]